MGLESAPRRPVGGASPLLPLQARQRTSSALELNALWLLPCPPRCSCAAWLPPRAATAPLTWPQTCSRWGTQTLAFFACRHLPQPPPDVTPPLICSQQGADPAARLPWPRSAAQRFGPPVGGSKYDPVYSLLKEAKLLEVGWGCHVPEGLRRHALHPRCLQRQLCLHQQWRQCHHVQVMQVHRSP